jgi:hypothetical protein
MDMPIGEAGCGPGPRAVEMRHLALLCEYEADTWFTATLGWMTFAPEWFSGSPNLDTSNWMYL